MDRRISRIAFAAAFAAIYSLALASGPDNQFGYKTPIVRIGSNAKFQGTGTVIDNMKINVNGKDRGFFCILTADHVISNGVNGNVRNNLVAAFGNFNNVDSSFLPGGGNDFAAQVIGRKGIDALHPNEKVDMAVLRVEYGDYNASYDQFVMGVSGTDAQVGDAFSSAGYGNQGARFVEMNPRPGGILQPDGMWWNGYKGSGKYQEQRFYYNSVDSIIDKDNWDLPSGQTYDPYEPSDPYAPDLDKPDGYAYESMVYDNTRPLDPDAIVGEGVGFNGDSGAPYMTWEDGQNMIVGIHTYGTYLDDPNVPGKVKLWGMEAGGVHLNDQYRDWIETQCMAPVPEPGSFVACALGLAGFAGMSKRRKK